MGATGKDVHIDVPLSNVAIGYKPDNMIADQIAPIVPVNKQSDGYYIWSAADAYRIENDKRAPGTEANVITRSVSSGTYFADNYALKDRIPYEDIENADMGFVITERTSRVEFVKSKLMLAMEFRVGQQCTSTSNVGSYDTMNSAWTDYTNSRPIADLKLGLNAIEDRTGQKPNSIIFGGYAWRHFAENSDVISRVYGEQTNGKTARMIGIEHAKAIFEVERVLVGGAYYNSADEGQAASLSSIWNDNVLMYYAPLKPRKDVPSFMYSFRWKKIMNMTTEVHQLPRAKAEEVEVGYYQDEKITASSLSFLIIGVGSSV